MAHRPWYRRLPFGPAIEKLLDWRSGARPTKRGPQSFRPTLEELEDRRTPSLGLPTLTTTGVFPVNTTIPQQSATTNAGQSVAAEPDGRSVFTWTSPNGLGGQVYAQIYNANGTPLDSAIVVNQSASGSWSSVAVDGQGNFVIAWRENTVSGTDIVARRFSATGQALSDEFQVDAGASAGSTTPVVAMDAGGDFVVAWQTFTSLSGTGPLGPLPLSMREDIYARRFAASGQPLADTVHVGVAYDVSPIGLSAAMDAQGNFVLAWSGAAQTGAADAIFARHYDASGSANTAFQVASPTSGDQASPNVAMDAQGDFVIVWASSSNFGWANSSIFAQRYDAADQAVGQMLQVNQQAGSLLQPSVAMDAQGAFVVSWSAESTNTAELVARRFDATGAPVSDTFQVDQSTTADAIDSSVAVDPAGDLVFSWTRSSNAIIPDWVTVNGGPSTDPSLFTIYGARYTATAAPTIPVDADPAPNTIAAGAVNGDTVGVTASSTDPTGLPLTYSLDDDAGGRFVIDSKSGVVTIANAALARTSETEFPVEFSNQITVRASDGTNSSTAEFLIAFQQPNVLTNPPILTLPIMTSPSPFQYDASTMHLVISATQTQNVFTFSQATSIDASGTLHTTYTFTLNGVTQTYTDAQLIHVDIIGANGTSSAILSTNDTYVGADGQMHETAETVVFGSAAGNGGGQILKPDGAGDWLPFLTISGFSNSYAYLGHADIGQLYASQGVPNEFVTAGAYSYMGAPGEFHLISGAAYVYGYSANPTDLAWHYDTAALDAFVTSGNAYSYLSGTDNGQAFFNEAVGFATTYALATHGLSIAYFIDSPGTNVFYGASSYSYLSGTSSAQAFFDEAQGFALVHATFSRGGTDFAYNRDLSLNLLSGTFTVLP